MFSSAPNLRTVGNLNKHKLQISLYNAISTVFVETLSPSSMIYKCKKELNAAAPLQAWSGPEGSRKLRFPDFTATGQGGGKVVSLMHRPHLPPGNPLGTHFSVRG